MFFEVSLNVTASLCKTKNIAENPGNTVKTDVCKRQVTQTMEGKTKFSCCSGKKIKFCPKFRTSEPG